MSAPPRHRGPHPRDAELFGPAALQRLRTATCELSWLLGRGYAQVSALQLVGDRHELRKRQRDAILRSACPVDARVARAQRRGSPGALAGATLWIDGFNCLITLEAALSGGVILRGRDGAHRDLSSVHGSYRRVHETERAIDHMVRFLVDEDVGAVRWLLDRPISNSGRLATMIRAAAPPPMAWQVELVYNPDRELVREDGPTERVTATSDAWILDRCGPWIDIPGAVIERSVGDPWLVDLRPDPSERLDP